MIALPSTPPPQNLDAEQAVLGALMVDSTLFGAVSSIVQPADFYAPQHQALYLVIKRLVDANLPVDKVGVAEELVKRKALEAVGGMDMLTQLLDAVPSTSSAEYYARIVREKSILRAIINVGSRISQCGWDQESEIADVVAKCEAMLRSATERGSSNDGAQQVGKMLGAWYDRLTERRNTPRLLMPFNALGECLGGLQPGCLYAFVGRPAHGKTTVAGSIAAYVAEKEPVCFAALEEGDEAFIDRQVAVRTGIPKKRLKAGLIRDDEWGSVTAALAEINELKLTLIGDARPRTLNELRADLRREKASERGLSLAIIDHSRVIEDFRAQKNQTDTAAIENALISLKHAAAELHIPVILLVHLNRKADDAGVEGPLEQHVLHSDAYQQWATATLAIWRPYKYDHNEDPKTLKVRVLKNRFGEDGCDFEFKADLATDVIREVV